MFVKKENVMYWKNLEVLYEKQLKENDLLTFELNRKQHLLSTVKDKMHGTHATIFDITEDRDGNETYIFVQDQRFLEQDSQQDMCYLKGDLNIFVLSSIIVPSKVQGRISDMPYMQAVFSRGHVTICELHSDIDGSRYERKGYATMMINSLIQIAKQANCTSVGGRLYEGDADTLQKKVKRNDFYKNRRFRLSFVDEEEREGSIYLAI